MIRLKHILHPRRSLQVLEERLRLHAEMRRVVRLGKRRFASDPRYRLNLVENGFACDEPDQAGDGKLLLRICAAYNAAIKKEQPVADTFEASSWWQLVRRANLGPVMRALADCDIDSLRVLYRNFFRNCAGAGLTGLPFSFMKGRAHKHLVLMDALHRLDTWKDRTKGQYDIGALNSPAIGNPFGLRMDQAFVRTGSEDQHFYAQKIIHLLSSAGSPVVAEIGGGFGGMAYYLIRDCPAVTYIDFDVPETVALASYYLLKAFPHLKATLYGEAELDKNTLLDSDIVLMPCFMLPRLPDRSVDVVFNSHVLSDLSTAAVHQYLSDMVRTTRGHILHLNRRKGCQVVSEYLTDHAPEFRMAEHGRVTWNSARSTRNEEFECLYTRSNVST